MNTNKPTENEALRTQQQECGNTPYDEGPFALAQPVAQRGAADGFFLLLPQRPKPEAPAGTAGLDWDAYSGAQMLAFGRDCSDAAIAALRTQQPAPATQQAGDVVAYLDVGASGYLDLGAALSEDALQQLPKGRHALVIAGTYGIDGYVAAPQPSPTTKPTPQQEAQQSLTPETGNSVSAKGAAITPESGKPPAEQQAAPKAALGVGNSGFDYKTAADFLNGKTVSDEAVRTFVTASRWAHDERAALSATLLAMHGVLTSREAEIALLKKALLEAEAAPQQEAQEPVAYVHVPHYPVEGKVRPVVSFEKYQQDYADGIYSTRIPLYTAPQPSPAPLSESIDQLERELAIIGVVGAIDGYDVVRRESVLEIARRAAIAAQGGQ